jgi:hypothetical protein
MNRLTRKQLRALEITQQYIQKSLICQRIFSDDAFARSMGKYKHSYTGEIVSAEYAYFLTTDRGINVGRSHCRDFEQYKRLMLAHRLFSMTVAIISEDVPKGIVFWPELHEDFPELCNAVRRTVGLNSCYNLPPTNA